MNIENFIRELAKKVESQNLFAASKEINGIYIFDNKREFSKLQQLYLFYLYFYDSIYSNIALKKVSEKVLDNSIREDSYSYYQKNKKEEKDKPKNDHDVHLVFKRNKKRKN